MRARGHNIRVEETDENMYAAIDVAAAKVLRQLRKYKTRIIDKKIARRSRQGWHQARHRWSDAGAFR